ncbi:MAG TPA: LysM peptidoglycan-binding domain-containing protein [Flexivirga sp.]|uniref:LysM peptidoglycan-binding domain-containing protein n=1 Tax=Flexivirga sp. TaxID=1962927 RepID=UPI002BC64958|nr:LysM peptidoglycan-binding domain-containing protein [Flexivirga sp.]HWC20849.1 LysM peptidoglycan-binding domain-containing protein [Flexivirga sp.]
MSAVARWDAPADLRQGRRHLRAVPTGPSASGGGPRVGVRVEPGGLRLTARGRRLAGIVAALALLIGGGAAARAWASTPPSAGHSVTVRSGETLSGVAHRAYPTMPISNAVTKVALANDLNGLQVVAGQQLRLP